MSDDERSEFKEQLNRIERCLLGDEELGQQGLVTVTKDNTRRIGALERAGVYLAGAAGVLALGWTVWSQWPRK